MEITEVKVRLVDDRSARLKAFCTMTLDREFVVRDIKVIDGAKGLFVAMPSRKVTDHCAKCRGKNHLRARFCNDCGSRLPGNRNPDPNEGSSKLHVDVAHPINSECRARVQDAVLKAYEEEIAQAAQPGYAPRGLEDEAPSYQAPPREAPAPEPPPEPASEPLTEPAPESASDEPEKGDSFGAGLI